MIWVSSDQHFGDSNIVHVYKTGTGRPARDFMGVDAMHATIIANHNKLVKPDDTWICLGDVAMKQAALPVIALLNGKKILVRGNHDVFPTMLYERYFTEIFGSMFIDGLLLTHIPVAPWSFGRNMTANVHGHRHLASPLVYRVADPLGHEGFSSRKVYVNVSPERTGYAPLSLEQLQHTVRVATTH